MFSPLLPWSYHQRSYNHLPNPLSFPGAKAARKALRGRMASSGKAKRLEVDGTVLWHSELGMTGPCFDDDWTHMSCDWRLDLAMSSSLGAAGLLSCCGVKSICRTKGSRDGCFLEPSSPCRLHSPRTFRGAIRSIRTRKHEVFLPPKQDWSVVFK